jgi:hypothetical protein
MGKDLDAGEEPSHQRHHQPLPEACPEHFLPLVRTFGASGFYIWTTTVLSLSSSLREPSLKALNLLFSEWISCVFQMNCSLLCFAMFSFNHCGAV